jgi:FtsP/CotA-like multicopper oxidase with cupredoxin domain
MDHKLTTSVDRGGFVAAVTLGTGLLLVPGPLVRMREGVPVTVDLFKDTDAAEFVHWHGLVVPADADGAAEEKTQIVPARGHLRYSLTPQPSGARFVHSHAMAMSDLSRGTYPRFAMVYIEPKANPGQYDQEVFLATHEWEPTDYTLFGETRAVPEPVETIPRMFGKINGGVDGFNRWTINGKSFDENEKPRPLQKGKHYRFISDNQTDDSHPVQLHRNNFELTNVYGKATAGVMKDVVLVKGYREIAVNFAPAMKGFTLFHCRRIRLHALPHADEGPVFGLGMIEELARHGYRLSAGSLSPPLQGFERKGTCNRLSKEMPSPCGECTGRRRSERRRSPHRRARYGNFFMNSSKATSPSAE